MVDGVMRAVWRGVFWFGANWHWAVVVAFAYVVIRPYV